MYMFLSLKFVDVSTHRRNGTRLITAAMSQTLMFFLYNLMILWCYSWVSLDWVLYGHSWVISYDTVEYHVRSCFTIEYMYERVSQLCIMCDLVSQLSKMYNLVSHLSFMYDLVAQLSNMCDLVSQLSNMYDIVSHLSITHVWSCFSIE